MLHPSYSELMEAVNSRAEEGEQASSTEPLLNCQGDSRESKADYRCKDNS